MNLVYNGQIFFTNLFVFGPLTAGCRFGFGARTGGLNQDQFVDDLNIATIPMAGFYVKGNITPFPSWNAPSTTPFNLTLSDFGAAVDPSSVTLSFNGLGVLPKVSKTGAVTTISYSPTTVLLNNSLNHIRVSLFDSSGPPAHVLDYDFTVGFAPLWSLAPGSRPYISTDVSSTPFQRSLGYNALSNQLYVISRTGAGTGLTINVLDADTGADLYQLNTNGITGGSIILLGLGVADDGAIYAANMVAPNTAANPLKVYRWANSAPSTLPSLVFTGDPANPANTTFRWGDSFTVGGAGINTRIMLDATNASTVAVLAPSDSFLTNFTSTPYTHTYAGNTVGRSLQFGPTNTFFLKKKSTAIPPVAQPWQLIRFDTPPATTGLISMPDFHPQVGLVMADLASGLAAGIFFNTNASVTTAPADRLVVYDVSNIGSPFQIAQYNFPANHQANANFIGSVVFGGGKIFALEGNNGLIVVPAVPPIMPFLTIGAIPGGARLSWTNPIPRFVLQSSSAIASASWTTIPGSNLGPTTITDTVSGGAKFYRLVKP